MSTGTVNGTIERRGSNLSDPPVVEIDDDKLAAFDEILNGLKSLSGTADKTNAILGRIETNTADLLKRGIPFKPIAGDKPAQRRETPASGQKVATGRLLMRPWDAARHPRGEKGRFITLAEAAGKVQTGNVDAAARSGGALSPLPKPAGAGRIAPGIIIEKLEQTGPGQIVAGRAGSGRGQKALRGLEAARITAGIAAGQVLPPGSPVTQAGAGAGQVADGVIVQSSSSGRIEQQSMGDGVPAQNVAGLRHIRQGQTNAYRVGGERNALGRLYADSEPIGRAAGAGRPPMAVMAGRPDTGRTEGGRKSSGDKEIPNQFASGASGKAPFRVANGHRVESESKLFARSSEVERVGTPIPREPTVVQKSGDVTPMTSPAPTVAPAAKNHGRQVAGATKTVDGKIATGREVVPALPIPGTRPALARQRDASGRFVSQTKGQEAKVRQDQKKQTESMVDGFRRSMGKLKGAGRLGGGRMGFSGSAGTVEEVAGRAAGGPFFDAAMEIKGAVSGLVDEDSTTRKVFTAIGKRLSKQKRKDKSSVKIAKAIETSEKKEVKRHKKLIGAIEKLYFRGGGGPLSFRPDKSPSGGGFFKKILSTLTTVGVALAPAAIAGGTAVLSEMAGKKIAEHQIGMKSIEQLNEMRAQTDVMGGGPQSFQAKLIDAELERRYAETQKWIDQELESANEEMQSSHEAIAEIIGKNHPEIVAPDSPWGNAEQKKTIAERVIVDGQKEPKMATLLDQPSGRSVPEHRKEMGPQTDVMSTDTVSMKQSHKTTGEIIDKYQPELAAAHVPFDDKKYQPTLASAHTPWGAQKDKRTIAERVDTRSSWIKGGQKDNTYLKSLAEASSRDKSVIQTKAAPALGTMLTSPVAIAAGGGTPAKVGEKISGEKGWTLGEWVYDLTHKKPERKKWGAVHPSKTGSGENGAEATISKTLETDQKKAVAERVAADGQKKTNEGKAKPSHKVTAEIVEKDHPGAVKAAPPTISVETGTQPSGADHTPPVAAHRCAVGEPWGRKSFMDNVSAYDVTGPAKAQPQKEWHFPFGAEPKKAMAIPVPRMEPQKTAEASHAQPGSLADQLSPFWSKAKEKKVRSVVASIERKSKDPERILDKFPEMLMPGPGHGIAGRAGRKEAAQGNNIVVSGIDKLADLLGRFLARESSPARQIGMAQINQRIPTEFDDTVLTLMAHDRI